MTRMAVRQFCDLNRSPSMLAQRAKPKSRGDDLIIAPGKRSAALGGPCPGLLSCCPCGLRGAGKANQPRQQPAVSFPKSRYFIKALSSLQFASSGRCRLMSATRPSKIKRIASSKLCFASSIFCPCPLAPGNLRRILPSLLRALTVSRRSAQAAKRRQTVEIETVAFASG